MEIINVYGIHAVEKLVQHRPATVQQLVVAQPSQSSRIKNIVQLAQAAKISIRSASKQELKDLAKGERHQGIVAQITPLAIGNENDLMDQLEYSNKRFLIALDTVEDPRNVGACIRSAEALGASGIILPKDKSASITPIVRKVACGAAEILPIFQVTNLVRQLKAMQSAGFWVYGTALDATSSSIFDTQFAQQSVLVLGAEGTGLRQLTLKTCDQLVHIPMVGTTESLNVSVAAGICCNVLMQQLC